MKRKILLLIPFLLLFGCQKKPPIDSSELTSTTDSTSETTSGSSEFVSENSDVVKLDFFGLNDFHGAIVSEDEDEIGWFKIASFFKSKGEENPDGVINLSSGDMWQGSADSNITRGRLLTDLMNDSNFEAMALGNHEFDWKDTQIINNQELATFPFLGINIFDKRTNERASFALPSTIVERKGVKIGIIGSIGERLESSIFYENVKDYDFRVPDNYIVQESKRLRNEDDVDIVVLLTHDSLMNNFNDYYETINGTNNGGKSYVDLVFCGHTHKLERYKENNVPILQTNGYGQQIMHVNIDFNKDTKEKVVKTYQVISASNIVPNYSDDQDAYNIYEEYYEREIRDVKEEVVGQLTGGFNYRSQIVNFVNYVMYFYLKPDYPELDLTIHNTGGVRVYDMPSGDITYGDIYRALPFDNEIRVIENVSVSDTKGAMDGYNQNYFPDGPEVTSPCTIGTIDYVSTSPYNSLRNYEQICTGLYCRELVADYFRLHGTVDATQFYNY